MDIMLIFVFVIAAFLGVELISKVPSQLHTPLMSGTNAISGITLVGAVSITAMAVSAGGICRAGSWIFCNYVCNNKCCRRLYGNRPYAWHVQKKRR